jgi:hypothetical protein
LTREIKWIKIDSWKIEVRFKITRKIKDKIMFLIFIIEVNGFFSIFSCWGESTLGGGWGVVGVAAQNLGGFMTCV